MGVLEGTPAERAVRVVTSAVVVLGLCLRARGYVLSTMSLWLDEATWALRLLEKPLADNLIRPVGFMAVTRWLARTLGASETVLRLLPWCAGVATVLMARPLARHLFRSEAARLLFVAIFALHPGAIDLSKEFKPYSLGLALHMGMLLLVLRHAAWRRWRDLAGALVLAPLAVLFAQDAVFAYPGLYLVMGATAVGSRRLRQGGAVLLGAVITVGVAFGLYLWVWSQLDQAKEQKYWGKKYDVFYVPSRGAPDQASWTASHYADLVAMPGIRRGLWTSRRYSEKTITALTSVDRVVWLLLHVAGLTFVLRARRFRDAVLLELPLVVSTLFNVLGYWPSGDFRTNLFSLVYSAGIAAAAVDRDAKRVRWEDLLPAFAVVIAPVVFFEHDWHASKRTYSISAHYPEAMQKLVALEEASSTGERETLVADNSSCTPFKYYARYHPAFSKAYGARIRQRFELVCVGDRPSRVFAALHKALRSGKRAWLLATNSRVLTGVDRQWPGDLEKLTFTRIRGDHLVASVGVKQAEPPPESPAANESEHAAEPEAESDD